MVVQRPDLHTQRFQTTRPIAGFQGGGGQVCKQRDGGKRKSELFIYKLPREVSLSPRNAPDLVVKYRVM